MASVYKRGRDKGKRRACYYFSYDDERGKRRTKKGFTDKRATEDLALEIEREVRRKKEGLVDASDMKRKHAAELPIDSHLTAFETSISKNSEKYVKLTMARIKRLVKEGGVTSLRNLDAESVESALIEMHDSGEIGNKTWNHYLGAIQQFCTYLVPEKLVANPLQGIKRLNAEVDVRHPRRALTAAEFSELLKSARASNESIQCYDGEQRARIYTTSYMTGLRRKEIASLTPSSFKLDASPPTVTIEAANSKHREKDVLPLHPELVAQLRVWLGGLDEDQPIFPKLENRRTWLMVRKDLERVGIPYRTKEGIADFHAAGRHTHITELLRNGTTLPEARELARHRDVRTTMRYTHIGLDDQARAVSNLPWPGDGHDGDQASDGDSLDGGGLDALSESQTSWQRHGSDTERPLGHLVSPAVNQRNVVEEKDSSSLKQGLSQSGTINRSPSLTGTVDENIGSTGSIPAASTELQPRAETCRSVRGFCICTLSLLLSSCMYCMGFPWPRK